MKKAIIYSRVSTDEQKEKGFSLQDQEARLREYCKKNNLEIVDSFSEHHSAKDFNRPEFQKILGKLKSKSIKADLLIVTKIDRFSRNALDTLTMVGEFHKAGIIVHSLQEGILDFKDPAKFFPLLIQTGAGEHENLIR